MRKSIFVGLLIFLAVVAGGYCITWYSQAAKIRTFIEKTVALINEKQQRLTYDSIETSGFPSDIMVSIVKPHFVGRVDDLLKSVPGTPTTANPFESLPEWSEDALLDGRLVFGINALSDHYSMRASGSFKHTSTIAGQNFSSMNQPKGDFTCLLQLERSGGIFDSLWNYSALVNQSRNFMNDFRMVDCNLPETSVIDTGTQAVLGGSGPMRFYVTHTPGATEQVRVYMKMTDVEITPQGDAMVAAYTKLFRPYATPTHYSVYGKQNMEMDFSFNGPADWKAASSNPPLDIHLGTFTMSSQAFNASASFNLTNSADPRGRIARLYFKSESTFGDQYDALMQNGIRNAIAEIYATKDKDKTLATAQAGVKNAIDRYTPEQLYAIIYPAIPNFHSLGKLTQAFDGGYQGNAEITAGDFTLSELELSATPYGITGKGSGKMEPGKMPAANVSLACAHCPQMIDDIGNYAMRLQKTLSYFHPDQPDSIIIDAKLIDGVKNFLRVIAGAKDNEDSFNYVIISDAVTGITINNRQINDVMGLYKEYILPVMNKQQKEP